MKAGWRARGGSDRHGVPVEMRFIDLFMAAVGALIFMAMLLVVLVPAIPPAPPLPSETLPREPPPTVLHFAITSRSLPPARVGEPYEVAVAFREATGRVAWRVAAGKEEIPAGLRFDTTSGVLAGVPKERTTARFVLHASDARSNEDQRPYELVVEPPARDSRRRMEFWFGAVSILLTLLAWLFCLVAIRHMKNRIAELKEAWQEGRASVTFRGLHQEQTVYLPGGIRDHEAPLATFRWISRVIFTVLMLLAAWFVWRIWIG